MPEAEAGQHAAKGGLDFLKTKAGPLPIGVWIVATVIIWWYFQKKQAKTSSQATDAAGNTGTIDPATGYVYGSPQDQAGLASQAGTTTGTTPSGGSTIAGQYPDNNSWARAAVNYLTGLGVDPSQANEAIQQYLASQPLTTQQQGDVNLAIQGIGSPPQLPGPVGTPPGQIVPPPGTGKTTVPPGLVGGQAGTAHNKITAAGLIPVADPGQKATDKVTSTTPAGGTSVPKGSQVLISASSSGAAGGTVTVPSGLIGRPAGDAHNKLVAAGLNPLADPGQKSTDIVTGTNPSAGAKVARGSTVVIAARRK